MLTFAGLVDYARAFDAQANNAHSRIIYSKMIRGALEEAWNGRSWSFQRAEAAVRLYPPFVTGTVTLVNGATTCVHSGTGFSTSWPTPAWIRVDGRSEGYLINSWNSTSSATLDTGFLGDNGSYEFRVEFPCSNLPTDFLTTFDPVLPPPFNKLRRFSYEEWQAFREWQFGAGSPVCYAIKDGDGIREPPKICLYPAPDVETMIRMIYRPRAPLGLLWDTGTATATSASASVAGAASLWLKAGFSMVDLVLEFPNLAENMRANGTVLSVGTDTALTLTSAWPGQTITAAPYVLSDRLRFPDYACGWLQSLCQVEVCKMRRDYAGIEFFKKTAEEQERGVAAVAGRGDSVREIDSLFRTDWRLGGNEWSVFPRAVEVS